MANCVSSEVNAPVAADTGPKEPSSNATGNVCEASSAPSANVLSVVGPGSLTRPSTVKVESVFPVPVMLLCSVSTVSVCVHEKHELVVASRLSLDRSAFVKIDEP